MPALLKIEHLEVRYGDLIGVADVSLEVPKGAVVALTGAVRAAPDGARRFIQFLKSPAGVAGFVRAGWGT